MMGPAELKELAQEIENVSRIAGAKIMEIYATDFETRLKTDASPVTEADGAAEALIIPALNRLTQDVPVVAEEAAAAGTAPLVSDGPFWLVDPLDGTKEFIKRNGEFTVNIALIDQRVPVLGCVFLPVLNRLYTGIVGQGATRSDDGGPGQPIAVREPAEDGLVVVGSRSHGDPAAMEEFLKGRLVKENRGAGSSLKFCLVAEGSADLYPRLGRTMEWDVAAGHAVLSAAGGTVTRTDGTPFTYAKTALFENPNFVAWGGLRP